MLCSRSLHVHGGGQPQPKRQSAAHLAHLSRQQHHVPSVLVQHVRRQRGQVQRVRQGSVWHIPRSSHLDTGREPGAGLAACSADNSWPWAVLRKSVSHAGVLADPRASQSAGPTSAKRYCSTMFTY